MADNAQTIWNYFKSQGLSNSGIAGLIGNLFSESGLEPTNLQNTYNKKLNMTNAQYTAAVDNGTYKKFASDGAGYGIAQWTFSARKQALFDFCKQKNKSIGDLEAQLEFLQIELTTSYSQLLKILKIETTVKYASDAVLTQFERPVDQSEKIKTTRAERSQNYYTRFKEGEQMEITKKTSTTCTSYLADRNIQYIVIHYTAGVTSKKGSAANTAAYFSSGKVEASADFIVDDETIVQYNPDIKNYYTWHCGGSRQNTYGGSLYGIVKNSNSIGIEVCSTNSTKQVKNPNDSTWSYTNAVLEKTIELVKYLMAQYNIDINHVVRHYDVTGKLCPGIIGWNLDSGSEKEWTSFKNRLSETAEEDEDMTQEKFNEMMNNYIASLAEKPATFDESAILWMQTNGLISGNEKGQLMPKKFLTRGEFAVVMQRFKEKFVK